MGKRHDKSDAWCWNSMSTCGSGVTLPCAPDIMITDAMQWRISCSVRGTMPGLNVCSPPCCFVVWCIYMYVWQEAHPLIHHIQIIDMLLAFSLFLINTHIPMNLEPFLLLELCTARAWSHCITSQIIRCSYLLFFHFTHEEIKSYHSDGNTIKLKP